MLLSTPFRGLSRRRARNEKGHFPTLALSTPKSNRLGLNLPYLDLLDSTRSSFPATGRRSTPANANCKPPPPMAPEVQFCPRVLSILSQTTTDVLSIMFRVRQIYPEHSGSHHLCLVHHGSSYRRPRGSPHVRTSGQVFLPSRLVCPELIPLRRNTRVPRAFFVVGDSPGLEGNYVHAIPKYYFETLSPLPRFMDTPSSPTPNMREFITLVDPDIWQLFLD